MGIEIDYALAYHVDDVLGDEGRQHLLKAALFFRDERKPLISSFRYAVPILPPTGPRSVGASETVGIYGGVEDAAQKFVSEVVERNIGDILVFLLARLMDIEHESIRQKRECVLGVLGPPLPKVVGRFASMRIPRHLRIFWFYSFPSPSWLLSFPGWMNVSRPGQRPSRLWLEDELVVEDGYVDSGVEYRVAWMNQYISYDNVYSNALVDAVKSTCSHAPWVDGKVQIPAVLCLAALYSLAERLRVFNLGDPLMIPAEVIVASLLRPDATESIEEQFLRIRSNLGGLFQTRPSDFGVLSEAHSGGAILCVKDLVILRRDWSLFLEHSR